MDDAQVPLEFQSLQDLDCKPSYQVWIEALKVILLDKLVQVHREKLK